MTRTQARHMAVGLMAVCALAAAAALPAMMGSRVSDRDLAEVLSARAGGTVTWRGEPEVSVFPRLQFALKDVRFLHGFDGRGRPVASIPRLEVSFRTLPLLWGRVEAAVLALEAPRIHVDVDAGDSAGWHAGAGLGALFGDLAGEPVTVVVHDGEVTYRQPGTGEVEVIHAVDVRSSWSPDLERVSVEGRIVHEGQALTVDAELEAPWDVFAPAGAHGRLSLDSGKLPPLLVQGSFSLARDRGGIAGLSISGASFESAGMVAHGNLSFARGERRPRLEGALAFEDMVLTPVLERWWPSTLAELLATPLQSRWLEAADVDLRLVADGADVGRLRVDDPVVQIGLRNGFLDLRLIDAGIAGGRVEGRVGAAPAGAGIRVAASGQVTALSVLEASQPLRPAPTAILIGTEQPPQGSASAAFDLAAQGGRVAGLVDTLSGWMALDVGDGSVDGADTIATLERLVESDAAIAEGEAPFIPVAGRTHFDALSAWVTAAEGTLHLRRLNLSGDRFEIALDGVLDMTDGEIDAQGTAHLYDDTESLLVALPFGVGGTWRHLMAAPGIPHRPAPLQSASLAAPPWGQPAEAGSAARLEAWLDAP